MLERTILRRRLDALFLFHAALSTVIGVATFFLPHHLASAMFGSEEHVTQEFGRLYGALTLAQALLVFKTRQVSDAFVRRTLCQAYCFAFGLQAVTLLRAHLTAPELHGILNVFAILTFVGVGAAYGLALYTLPLSAFDSLDRAVR